MRAGDRIGPWELLAEAPGEAEVLRWRARHGETGEPAEVLALRSPRGRAGDAAFAEVHRRLSRVSDPGLVRTLHVEHGGGATRVVRQPLEDATLARIRGPLPPTAVAAVGARLLPAVVAAGGATGGALRAEDVGLDHRGQPVLAPRARPSIQVSGDDTLWVAPEAFEGQEPDGAAGLYGLGVLLYRLSTGRDPRFTPGRSAPPPPSPSSIRAGIPPALDRAILQLLDRDPVRRAGAMPLLQQVAGEVPDLRPRAGASLAPVESATMDPGEVVYTTTAPARSRGRADVASWRAAVVIPAAEVAALEPAARSAAAGEARLPLAALDDLGPGLPLVLDTLPRTSDARARAGELHAAGLPVRVVGGSGLARAAAAALLLVLSLGLVLVAAVAGLAPTLGGLPTVGLVGAVMFLLLAATAGVGGGWAAWSAVRGRAELRLARKSQEAGAALQERLGRGRSRRIWERIAGLRRQLASSDLPGAAEADLRGGLKEVEAHLHSVARMADNAEEALGRVDLAQLRTRLASLAERAQADASLVSQRDRLGRTVADLEALEEQQRRMDADLQHIEDALDEIQATLGHTHGSDELDPGAVHRLLHSTRLARETFEQLDEGPARPGRDGERA